MLQEVIKDPGPSSLLPYHPYHVAESLVHGHRMASTHKGITLTLQAELGVRTRKSAKEIIFLLCTLSLQTQLGYL